MPQITNKSVGPIGYGLMGLTWRPTPPPQEQSFAAMRQAIKAGATNWNGGELYGTPEHNSLHLLNKYFTQYPEDSEKVVLSIKGGLIPGQMAPGGDRTNVRRSIDECLKVLDGKKFLDIFQCARVDPKVPIEDTVSYIAEYVKEGKLGGIGLSEVGPKTIRRAHAVHPIAAVEVEFSLWATEILDNGIAKTCGELGIPIIAYAPLGRGFLTGQLKSYDDLEERHKHYPRFQPDVFHENLKLVDQVKAIADKKGVTSSQIAIAWVRSHSGKNGLPTIVPIPGASTADRVAENSKDIELTSAELDDIAQILAKFEIKGGRYPKEAEKLLNFDE